jgi:hypothetical protein
MSIDLEREQPWEMHYKCSAEVYAIKACMNSVNSIYKNMNRYIFWLSDFTKNMWFFPHYFENSLDTLPSSELVNLLVIEGFEFHL